MTIIEFLNARYDEDEAYARFAFADHNRAGPTWHEIRSGAVSLGDYEDELLTFDAGVSRHIARHHPARVLREVAAHRTILAIHHPYQAGPYPQACRGCPHSSTDDPYTEDINECPELRTLASIYTDHPEATQQ